jgi:hypothetical protein
MALYPLSVANQRVCPNFLIFRYLHFILTFESIKEFESASQKTRISFNNIKILNSKFQKRVQKTNVSFNNDGISKQKFQEHVHTTWISFCNIEISSSKFKDMSKKPMQVRTMIELGVESFKNMNYNQNLQQCSSKLQQWWSLELKVSRNWNTTKICNNTQASSSASSS